MESRYPGECAACGGRYMRGDQIKIRWEKHEGTWVRVPGRYSHIQCPKVRVPKGVDPDTGEITLLTPSDDQLTLDVGTSLV